MNGEQQSGAGSNERISPTALLTAYGRTLTDIPFSRDIFEESEKIRLSKGEAAMPVEFQTPATAPRFEARHKLINRLLRQSGVTQVLEIAAGLSPRGLEMTADPDFTYAEVDLTGNAQLKQKIVDAITAKPTVGVRTNLSVEEGDALDLVSLQAATTCLDRAKPIAIITEGLLRYLNPDEKTTVAKNIQTLLKQFGGVWITSDTTAKRNSQNENAAVQAQSEKTKQTTGINTDLNLFKDSKETQDFFQHLGFTVEDHQLMEAAKELISPKKLGQTDKEVETLLSDKHV